MKNHPVRPLILGLLVFGCCALAAPKLRAGAGAATTPRTTYPSSTQVGEAMISVDSETRSLIIITDDETAEQMRTVVARLDRSPPQVLINVVFLEVTYRKGSDIGFQGSYTRTFGGNDEFQGTVQQAFNGLPGLMSGAGIYQIVGDDFQVTLRALAEAGRLEVLSRPSILARNNQQAIITVGQRVPLITSVRFDNFGNQLNGIAYEDVGIILQVTPFITSDGLVEMILAPQISALAEQGVNIAGGGTNETGTAVSAPIINIRRADTVVVTPDGQTIVIGGLMSNNTTESESKVPLLGDIPLLGRLFKRKVKNDTKTELLIFLTPHIVKTPGDLAKATSREAGSTRIIPKAFSEDDLNRFFNTLPGDAEPPLDSGQN